MIDIPKGFSSKMTLEVAPRGLDIATGARFEDRLIEGLKIDYIISANFLHVC